jgi:hypothetical protein
MKFNAYRAVTREGKSSAEYHKRNSGTRTAIGLVVEISMGGRKSKKCAF